MKPDSTATTKTNEIFKLSAPYANPFQGTGLRLLFVCSAGLLRSPTGANLFAKKGYNTRSAGSSPYALIPLSANLIAWADAIFFVNEENFLEAIDTFDQHNKFSNELKEKAVVLDIPDNFEYNHPTLVQLLDTEVTAALQYYEGK